MRPARLPDELNVGLPGPVSPWTRLQGGGGIIPANRDTHDIADAVPQVAY